MAKAKFADKVQDAINPATYTKSDGTTVYVKDMIDDHLMNAALKIIREEKERGNRIFVDEASQEEKLTKLALNNATFRSLWREIQRRDL